MVALSDGARTIAYLVDFHSGRDLLSDEREIVAVEPIEIDVAGDARDAALTRILPKHPGFEAAGQRRRSVAVVLGHPKWMTGKSIGAAHETVPVAEIRIDDH